MKKFLSLVLALVMVLSLGVTAGAVSFTDDAAITKEEAVGVLAGLGIINGYEAADGTFSFAPNGNITRGAAAKIICMIKLGTKVAGILSCETAPFKDVAKDSTFAPYIAYCAAEGIVGGYTDGTYKPGNPVTGYAFTKMLLNALGIEGQYEGANYGVNVALAADKAGLFAGMDADTVYGANCIREDACQLAFNALNYSATGKTSKYVVKDAAGKTLYSGTDALTALVMKESAETNTLELVESAEDSLGAKNFKLTKGTKTDDFGRVSTVYTNGETETSKKVTYATFANNAKLTYTTATTEGKIFTALGFTKAADEVTLNVYTNGATTAEVRTLTKGDKTAIGAQGTLVEIYATDDAKVFNAYVIETFVYEFKDNGDITKAVAATATTDAVDAFVTIDELDYKTAAFKKGDVVLYTKTASKIVNIVKAASVVGKVTAEEGGTNKTYFRVDGVQYKLAAKNTAVIGDTAGYKYAKDAAEYTYYLDTYGNVIFAAEGKKTEVKASYIYITQVAAKAAEGKPVAGGDLFSGSTNTTAAQAQVKVVDLATGAVSVKNVGIVKNTAGKYVYADKTGAATTDEVEDVEIAVVNGIYEYYTLADGSIVIGDAATTTSVTVEKNKAAIADGIYANSATKLTVVTLTKDAKKENVVTSATVSTVAGIANFPEKAKAYAAIVTKDKKGVASELVAVVDKAAATAAVNYAIYKAPGEVSADTKYAFYQKGAVVEYAAGKDFVATGLEANKVYDLTITEGKLTAAAPKTAVAAGKVTVVDATFVVLEGGQVVYFTTGAQVYDANNAYVADTIAVDDYVEFYGKATDKVDFSLITKAPVQPQ